MMHTDAATVSPFVQRTVGRLTAALRTGRFRTDRPLPPHRQWARRLKVSSFTVNRAFRILADQGVIESREGSYTFLCRPPEADGKTEVTPARQGARAARVTLWLTEFQDLRRLRQAEVRRRFQQAFQHRHPQIEIHVELQRFPPGAMTPVLFQHLLQGAGPTICEVKRTDLAFLLNNQLIAPFPGSGRAVGRDKTRAASGRPFKANSTETCAGSDSARWRDYAGSLRPEYLETAPDFAGRKNGPTAGFWLLPVSFSFSFLFYNRTLFHKAGLDAARPPRDWAELDQAVQRLAATGPEHPFQIFGMDTAIW
ncbi:MAG: extracellular solute-binding protein [Verrucomicrobia bacterium]|nr:extracellular solute-binding protein [Verrucomicrobiota bacterium]